MDNSNTKAEFRSGFQVKTDILDMIYDWTLSLREAKCETPFDEYIKNAKICFLQEVRSRILDMPLVKVKNGGYNGKTRKNRSSRSRCR